MFFSDSEWVMSYDYYIIIFPLAFITFATDKQPPVLQMLNNIDFFKNNPTIRYIICIIYYSILSFLFTYFVCFCAYWFKFLTTYFGVGLSFILLIFYSVIKMFLLNKFSYITNYFF